jgi:7,8-dihydropterin-6-yl-methyl-4-(beta-D-ribofuranosyl)aminobenzene 5'-phosphate synthase
MKVTVLCENAVGKLIGYGEHGFSAFIETDRGNYLFDTGTGHCVVANSLALKKDLKTLRRIFLSHGHYDHTGGLPEVLKLSGKVDVHAHPNLFSDRIAIHKQDGKENPRFVGLPYKKRYLEYLGANFVLNTEFTEVEKGMFLTGEVPRKTTVEKQDITLFTEENGKRVPDVFPDDQSLIVTTWKGLVLILGCAHAGIVNIIDHVTQKMGRDDFHAILGGTHLDFHTPAEMDKAVQFLKKLKIEKIGVSHCTGMRASIKLSEAFGDRFFQGCVGSVLEVE